MLVGSTERLENAASGRGSSRLPSLGLGHMSRSSGPLSYGFQSLEASMNADDVQDDSPLNAANLKTEMLDSSSEAAIETSDKSQLTDKPVQANKTTAISRRTLIQLLLNFNLQLILYAQPLFTKRAAMSVTYFSVLLIDESPETEVPPPLVTPTSPTVEKVATPLSGRSRTEREQRSGNTLYQELSFQDADALGEMDEGADITGNHSQQFIETIRHSSGIRF